jgi:hypothetical protein
MDLDQLNDKVEDFFDLTVSKILNKDKSIDEL